MPFFKHHALLIVGYGHDDPGRLGPIEAIRSQLSDAGRRLLIGPTEISNSLVTYVLSADGCGESIGTSREVDMDRVQLAAAAAAAGYDVVHLSFGGDVHETTVEFTTDNQVTTPIPSSVRPVRGISRHVEVARALNQTIGMSDPLLVDPMLDFETIQTVRASTQVRRFLTTKARLESLVRQELGHGQWWRFGPYGSLEEAWAAVEDWLFGSDGVVSGAGSTLRVSDAKLGGRFFLGSLDSDPVVVFGVDREWESAIARLSGIAGDVLRSRLLALWNESQPAIEWFRGLPPLWNE